MCSSKHVAALDGGAAGLGVASVTSAVFYSIINLAQEGDEIISANNLYGGTYTQLMIFFQSLVSMLSLSIPTIHKTMLLP